MLVDILHENFDYLILNMPPGRSSLPVDRMHPDLENLENLKLSGNFEKLPQNGNSQGISSEVREFKLKSGNFQLKAVISFSY